MYLLVCVYGFIRDPTKTAHWRFFFFEKNTLKIEYKQFPILLLSKEFCGVCIRKKHCFLIIQSQYQR